MNPTPLRERERFVVRGLVYKVIRARPNGKFTIRLKGVYTPPKVQPLTSKEKETEKKFFDICEELDEVLEETNQEKEEPKDGKKDDSGTREEPVPGEEGNNSPATGSQLPRADGVRPTFG